MIVVGRQFCLHHSDILLGQRLWWWSKKGGKGLINVEQTWLETLSHKAVKVLGHNVIDRMSDPQVNLLDRALARLVAKMGPAEAVSDLEIEGQYEQIMYHVLPTGSHEHFFEKIGLNVKNDLLQAIS